jgi:hypothetical protein
MDELKKLTYAEKCEISNILLHSSMYSHGPSAAIQWVIAVINAIEVWEEDREIQKNKEERRQNKERRPA